MKIVLVTGGFDPLHSGHIEYFKAARALGDKLIVGVNSDAWLERKKGKAFMPISERVQIIENLKMVDGVLLFMDHDGSAIEAIRNVQLLYPNDELIFANGGDRTATNIPEMLVPNVIFKFGVGGNDKKNSSSWILDEWKLPKTKRPWGFYRVLYDTQGTKVKELVIEPNKSLRMQKHHCRSEYWFVAEGSCQVETDAAAYTINSHDDMTKINVGTWHKLSNPFETPCKIVEIQYGEQCIEEDIEVK